jgi:hypothetical protein
MIINMKNSIFLTASIFTCLYAVSTYAVETCTFSGSGNPAGYGYLYVAHSWDAKKITDSPAFPCFDKKGNSITEFYDQEKTFGPTLSTIEVLQDTIAYNHHFHKGETFQATSGYGEGQCDIIIGKDKLEDSECPWLLGYADHQSDIFRIKVPTGPQHWYHLVDKQGNAIGWYLTNQSDFDPVLKPLD